MFNRISFISSLFLIFFPSCYTHSNGDREINVKNDTIQFKKEIINEVEITGLLYHRFGEAKYPSTNISTGLFRKHLQYLKENGFKVITMMDALKILKKEGSQGKYVVITIDDAFQSFYVNGFPLLREFGFPATIYVNTETVGSGDYLGWAELVEISKYGIEIGNHTHSHDYFLNMDSLSRRKLFVEDVEYAQRIIRQKLDIECMTFAYPFGEYDPAMRNAIRDLRFQGASAQNSGVISAYSDFYALPRFPMTDTYGQMERFQEKISMKPMPVIGKKPESTIAYDNPPILYVRIKEGNFNFSQMQCFIQGADCRLSPVGDDAHSYQIIADKPLRSRRHLYTITVPDVENQNWYWFSHQWVFPENTQ